MNLFTLIRTRKYKIGIAIRIGIFLFSPLFSFSQTFFGVASNPADNGTVTGPTVAVAPPGAMVAGDLVVMYAHYRANAVTYQYWQQPAANHGPRKLHIMVINQSTAVFWCRYNGTWAANPSVTVGAGALGLSAIMYVYRPTNAANSWGIHSASIKCRTGISCQHYHRRIFNPCSQHRNNGLLGQPR